MLKQVFKDSLVYAVPTAISQGLSFLLFPLLAHTLDPRDYGVVDLLTVIGMLVHLTIALEVSQGLGRYFVDARAADERRAYASTALVFTIAVYTVFASLSLALAVPLAELVLGESDLAGVLRVAVLWMWAYGLLYIVQSQLRWELRPAAFAVSSVAAACVTVGLTAALVLIVDQGVIGVFWGQLAGSAVGAFAALIAARGSFALRFDRDRLREMLAFSVPLVPASVGVFLGTYVDRVAIQVRLDLGDVGIYGAGFRVASVVALVMIAFQSALTPRVLHAHSDPATPGELARIFRWFVALALIVGIALSVFAEEILALLASAAFSEGASIVPLLVPATFLAGMYIFAPGPGIAKRMKPFAAISVATGVANAVLAFALVGPLGITGAALAAFISSAAGFAALMALSQRLYPVPHLWAPLALAVAGSAMLVGAMRLLLELEAVSEDSLASLPLKFAATIAGSCFCAYVLLRRPVRKGLG